MKMTSDKVIDAIHTGSNLDAEDAFNESDQNSFAFYKEKGGLPGMAEQGGKRGGG